MLIKRYQSDNQYQRDALTLLKQGYKVANVVSEKPRAGCLRIILTGGLGLLWGPKPQLVVTYTRS